VAPASQSDR